jgi:dihydroorotase
MLVDNPDTLERLFSKAHMLIAAHCEYEPLIRENLQHYKQQYGEDIPVALHPVIRNREACLRSSEFAVNLARRHNTRLHVLHISTADELALFSNEPSDSQKRITAEVCVHHLWFSDHDYAKLGNLIKWNPAIKTAADRASLLLALTDNRIDVIATDHAPHTLEEKNRNYTGCPSGGPLVQHSLVAMLEKVRQGEISNELVVDKMCHAPSRIFNIDRRGYIRKGYFADIVLVDTNDPWAVSKDNILYKCGWSPFEGITFHSKITHTFVNGNLVYHQGNFNETYKGSRLLFKN